MFRSLPRSIFLVSIFLIGCSPKSDGSPHKPAEAYILVETADMNKPGDIMHAVQLMLVQHETYRLKMATHGFGTPTSYEFKFKGDCVADKALVAEVSRIIRKTTNALIVCTNTPPDAEPLLPPNVPK